MDPWDDDFRIAGPSDFLDRARNAPDDDDFFMPDAPPLAGPSSALDSPETPLQELIRHWINERHAPDILQGKDILLGSLLDHIRRQSDTVQLLRSDPDTSEEEHLRIMLVQTEVERVKFVVRSYLRTRLYKIEKYARYVMANEQVQTRLSQSELDHCQRYTVLFESQLRNAVLKNLPEQQRSLDEAVYTMPKMITEPDLDRAVFVRARKDCDPVRLPDNTALELKRGDISLTPYRVVEHLVARGEVDLV